MKILTTLLTLQIGFLFCSAELRGADQNVVILLDDSGSMNDRMRSVQSSRMDTAKNALMTVLADIPDSAAVGVRALNSTIGGSNWIVPLGPVDRTTIEQRIGSIRAQGGTPLGAAMKDGADALLAARETQLYGTYRLLIVTDGEAGDAALVELYLPIIKARGLVTDVIGVDMAGDHSLATEVQTYRRADDPSSLRQAIAEVFAETIDNDANAGESDYDLLSGLQDDVAMAAVTRLTQTNNQRIGNQSPPRTSSGTTIPMPRTVTIPSPTAQPGTRGGSGLGGLLFVGVIVVVVVFGFMAKQLRSGGPRSR